MLTLPAQTIHNDGHWGNVLCDPAAPDTITGVIDFGDQVEGPLVVDLATSMFGLTHTERECLRVFGRGKALWKIGDRSLIGRHDWPDTLRAETDTDTMMRRRPAHGAGGPTAEE